MDLIAYIEQLSPIKISGLYGSPYICQAVLRSLPPLAKQYVLRFLFLDSGVPRALVDTWALPSAERDHNAALAKLQSLQLLSTTAPSPDDECYQMHGPFQQQVREAVCTSMMFQRPSIPSSVLGGCPAGEQVEGYARAQWERLLLYVVGSTSVPPAPHPLLCGSTGGTLDVAGLLLGAGLALQGGSGGRAGVSQGGFRFLLMDTYHQIWLLLRQYITALEGSSAELCSAISFLLQLGSGGGLPLCLPSLPTLEQSIAAHMAQLGLLLPFRPGGEGEVWLHPTRLASLLAAEGGGDGEAGEGFIVVESNYRVYAYTTSPVQQSILRLFVRCDVLLPNLFVGTLSRESVRSALELGITADQIVGYLRQHAHPRVALRSPVLPLVVSEQITLWQAELRRLRSHRATAYSNFETPQLYTATAAFAQRLGAVLYRNDQTRQLVVLAEAHDQLRAEIKALKQSLGV